MLGVSAARDGADDGAGERGARQFQKIPAADFHVRHASHELDTAQRISMSFQRVFSLVAW